MKFFWEILDFLDRHKNGILATLVLHLFIITCFLVLKMRTQNKHQEAQMLIDFSQQELMEKQLQEMQKQVKAQPKQEFINNLEKQYLGKNIAVNESHDAQQSINKMVDDIKSELGVKDPLNRDADRQQPKIDSIKTKKPATIEKKPDYTLNEKGEPTFYRGKTTVSYNLAGRSHLYVPIPVYQCEGSGKVVMDIAVNPKGYVLSATINKSESQITEQCLIDAAIRYAQVTRFTEKAGAAAQQKGTITYIFIAQ
jgi:hypothetical protein